ncbi:DoxX family protein [Flexivirga sp. ID2601S]|uniref:DoxX family protein n=1 Tax=Flexivirga aerilata TaxID=1656889 RepID=A0A849ALE6_9MICO|nr:DoxX family protein [Flexivirga aerilata]NNG40346.1 DoxX family protein [Flexivirga aerilata]
MTQPLRPTAKVLVAAFAGSGIIHLVRPQVFEPIVPPQLPRARELVYASGVAELACAAGLLLPRTRQIAGKASAGLLVGVLPANLQMTLDAGRAVAAKGAAVPRVGFFAGTVARLPLQWPLIRAAWTAGR